MSSTYSKVKIISEDTQLSDSQVANVLQQYLTWCLQEILIDGKSKTIFGEMTLDENNRLHLDTDKFGLISLLNKSDIKLIRKIVEDGPDIKIFEI